MAPVQAGKLALAQYGAHRRSAQSPPPLLHAAPRPRLAAFHKVRWVSDGHETTAALLCLATAAAEVPSRPATAAKLFSLLAAGDADRPGAQLAG